MYPFLRQWRSAFLALLAAIALPALAQTPAENGVVARSYGLTPVLPGEYNGDLRHLPPIYVSRPYVMLNEFEPPPHHKPLAPKAALPSAPNLALAPMPAPSANFAGLGFDTSVSGGNAGGGWPPDTNGDVGPTVYIQAVNVAFGIFDKGTGTLQAAFTEDQLWSTSGLSASIPCLSNNQGDPIVLHDALNDRWLLTDFAFAVNGSGDPVSPTYECIAVSKSGDPVAGGWWFYAVRMDVGGANKPPLDSLADYPKFGLWGDGCLYMGANAFDNSTGNYLGPVFATFNTANMYAGAALTSSLGMLADTSVFGMFPANLLGTAAGSLPPSGRPEFFVSESSNGFSFDVRKYTKGANCGGGGTLGNAVSVNQDSYGYPAIKKGASYTEEMVQQSGTTNRLDSLGDRIMQKVQYRKIGSAESLWVVHTTCGSGQNVDGACASNTSPARPQWAQINVTSGTIATTPVQQQIYAPLDSLSRWMGSLAVDTLGNMALGYSTSSATNFPSIAYSGRKASDPLNNLSQTETQLVAGLGSQDGCGLGCSTSRWGDYSAMSIDPADDCTFWYTNEYYDTAGHASNGRWQTRIGAFKFPGCVGPPSKLAFTQQPNASYSANGTITVKVSVEAAGGQVITSDTSAVTLTLQGGNGSAVLGGTTTVNAVAGVATFNVSIDKVGNGYTLHATDGTLTPAESNAFNIVPGTAKKLAFTTQPPASSQAGATFTAVVTVEDAAGNTVTSDGSAVTVGLACGSCAQLFGATTLVVSNGVATFSSLNVRKVGNYQLKATDSNAGVTSATSSAFDIVQSAPSKLVFTTQPLNVAQGSSLNTIAVSEQDQYGNTISSDSSSSVDFSVPACGDTVDLGQATMSSGVATLTSKQRFYTQVGKPPGLQITANAAGLGFSVLSQAFAVGAPASEFIFSDGFDDCRL